MGEKYTTSKGVTVEFENIALLLDKIRASHRLPDPPVYEVKTAAGPVEKHAHTSDTLETDEDRAAWAKYLEDDKAARDKLNDSIARVVLLRGIKAPPTPDSDDWVKEHEFLGLTVPTDPLERRLHWIETEVIGSVADMTAVTVAAMRASEVPEELLSQMEATFRSPLRQPNGNGAGRSAQGRRQMVDEQKVRGGKNGRAKPHRKNE